MSGLNHERYFFVVAIRLSNRQFEIESQYLKWQKRRMKTRWRLPAALVLLALPAAAQDAFEIQVYNAETAAPLQFGAEVHLNHFFVGSQAPEGGELPTHHVTHLTLEPHLGLAEWCEAGVYLTTALRADGTFDFTGFKLRFKARWPKKLWGVLGLALNQEFSVARKDYEENVFGWEIRPVIDFEWKRLYLSTNPILSVPLGGALAGRPEFEPSFKGSVRVLPFMAVGAEYYAAFGPIAQATPLADQVHRVFGALDFDWKWGRQIYEVNFGVGYGITGPEKWIAKLIFAFDLEPAPRQEPDAEVR